MSADAGSTGADSRIEESASAAENAFSGDDEASWSVVETELFCEDEAEHKMADSLGFDVIWEFNFGFEMGLYRFVGIERAISLF